KSILGS
ncbi:unnamed protein product, partial [Allacma fusca]